MKITTDNKIFRAIMVEVPSRERFLAKHKIVEMAIKQKMTQTAFLEYLLSKV